MSVINPFMEYFEGSPPPFECKNEQSTADIKAIYVSDVAFIHSDTPGVFPVINNVDSIDIYDSDVNSKIIKTYHVSVRPIN